MKNDKLAALMEARGFSKSALSKVTGISASTLNRIINNEVKHVKMSQMQAIASALGTPVHAVFDTPSDQPMTGAIRPDEVGQPVMKLLSRDECFLIFWYQNSSREGRERLFTKAKSEYEKTVVRIQKEAEHVSIPEKQELETEQLTFQFDF